MKSTRLWPVASSYLKSAANRFKLSEAVEVVKSKARVPLSLSVNVRLQVPPEQVAATSSRKTESHPLRIERHGEGCASPSKGSANDQFETAMNEFVVSNEHQPRSSEQGAVAGNSETQVVANHNSGQRERNDDSVQETGASSLPRLSRSAIYSRSKQLVKTLYIASDNPMKQVFCLQELCRHILLYPEAAAPCVKEGAIPIVLSLRSRTSERSLLFAARQALALLGYSDPPKGQGIRILSIDGGGIRGVVILEVLRELEHLTGKPINQMFDVICGVSTGAILTMLVGALKKNISACDDLYRTVSKSLLVSDFWRGTSRLLLTHAYYDTSAWEKILRDVYSEKALIETSAPGDVPKCMAVSASLSARIKPYVFRNFNLPVTAYGQYEGSCRHKVWESVRASSSAPGYFEDFVCGNHVHSDGGILINNPAAIAIHEAQLIWPNESIQCVISVGTGKYSPVTPPTKDAAPIGPASLKAKITSLVDSATDTEITHRLLQDLLPAGSYFRMNPTLSEWLSMDENRTEKLDQLKTDAAMYVRKNEHKMKEAAGAIAVQRTRVQRARDFVNLKFDSSIRK